MRIRSKVAVLGAVGAATTLRVGWGAGDSVAYGVLGLILGAFGVGIYELWTRAGQADARRAALEARQIETVGDWVESYRAGRSPTLPVGVTPYLVGLLVMLGVLGTFLGLVDTLGGAGALVRESSDLGALRADLAAPLGGLTRAFTTSLAGIGASACLGLALVLVRRAERRAVRAFTRFAAQNLAAENPAGRQLALLEAIVAQGSAIPAAAEAMGEVVARLDAMTAALDERIAASLTHAGDTVAEAQLQTAAALRSTLAETTKTLQSTISSGFETTRVETTRAVANLAKDATRAAASAAADELGGAFTRLQSLTADAEVSRNTSSQSHLADIRTLLDGWTRTQGEAIQTRASAEEAHLDAVRSHLDGWTSAQTAAADAHRSAEREQVDATLVALHRLTEAQAQAATDRSAAEQAHLATLQNQMQSAHDALLASVDARAEAHTASLAAQVDQVSGGLNAVLETTQAKQASDAAQAEAISARLNAVTVGVEALAERATQADAARLAAFTAEVETLRAALAAAVADTVDRSNEVGELVAGYRESLDALEARTAERLGGVVAKLSGQLAEQIEHYQSARATQAGEAANVISRLDEELERHLGALGERLAAPLAAVTEATRAAPAAASALVAQAADRLAESLAADATRNAALDSLITRIDGAGAGLDRLVEQQRNLAGSAETAQQARLDALLSKMDRTLDQQAERLTAFEARLSEVRAQSADQLAAKLTEHAAGLGERLGATTTVVREAADLLRAGGAELSAVAEMFADAVDGYRASSDQWLQTLSELQGVLGRSGEEEAGRLVGEYLDQTREVFGDAMRFQRELFTELRALRSTP